MGIQLRTHSCQQQNTDTDTGRCTYRDKIQEHMHLHSRPYTQT